ncbi:probable RNA-directed DNA polymerase from transposon BS [Trichonephila clavipes]|nr:probable RNA-directed DNA polymerase from transposon BS [Trichonephila clavipes]
MLSNYVNQLTLLWTPGHSKIVWNEQADNLARSVTESNVYIDWIASEDIHKNIYRNRIQKINETFYSSKYFEKLGNIPTIDIISNWTENQREEILSTRIFSKMIITPGLLHRFNLQNNAMCITSFRTHHSTTDQLFYLNQSIIDGFQEKPHKKTLAVFLDISAAFDRVWHQKLVHTIQGTGINGKALLWINDFLRGRKFSVRFNGALSESRRMWAGVPQGPVLSPLLFLIFMNTIHHHIHPDTNIACYADDIAIWHSHNDITESEKALNTTLKGIAEWAENLKLTINADKTNYCIFSTDRRHRSSFNTNIKIQNSQIKKSTYPPILEVPSGAPHSKKPTKEYLFRIGIVAAMFQKKDPVTQTKRTGNDSNTLKITLQSPHRWFLRQIPQQWRCRNHLTPPRW